MYTQLPDDIRTEHPYYMYEEIRLQPPAIERALQIVAEQGAPVVAAVMRARRVYVTGCGTSFHAAQVGAWMLRAFTRGRVDARAVQAFEFGQYEAGLRPDDLLIAVSHSGGKSMTVSAVRRAQTAGMESVAVTGFPESAIGNATRMVLPTGYAEERSWAHTISYTAAVTTLAGVANDGADQQERLDLSPLSTLVSDVLNLEEAMHRLAAGAVRAHAEHGQLRVVLTGAGANAVTATEGVLKLLETSYVAAEHFELEEMLHGPLAAVTPHTLVFMLVPPGPSTERARELVSALEALQVVPVVLCGEENAERFDAAHRLVIPDVPEIISAIPYVVPLQLFSYFLAVGMGSNPDLLHRYDEKYRIARGRYS